MYPEHAPIELLQQGEPGENSVEIDNLAQQRVHVPKAQQRLLGRIPHPEVNSPAQLMEEVLKFFRSELIQAGIESSFRESTGQFWCSRCLRLFRALSCHGQVSHDRLRSLGFASAVDILLHLQGECWDHCSLTFALDEREKPPFCRSDSDDLSFDRTGRAARRALVHQPLQRADAEDVHRNVWGGT